MLSEVKQNFAFACGMIYQNIGCDATSNVEAAYSSKYIYRWKAEMKQSFEKIYNWVYT
jgi:hypothetical protein